MVTFPKSCVLCVLLERGSLQTPSLKKGLLNPEGIQNNFGNFEGYTQKVSTNTFLSKASAVHTKPSVAVRGLAERCQLLASC